jgi:hypothetical protein
MEILLAGLVLTIVIHLLITKKPNPANKPQVVVIPTKETPLRVAERGCLDQATWWLLAMLAVTAAILLLVGGYIR